MVGVAIGSDGFEGSHLDHPDARLSPLLHDYLRYMGLRNW